MENRCKPDYQLTPDTPGSPESNTDSDSDMDKVESALPILFLASTEIPVVTLLGIIYKLHKLNSFKVLKSFL
jgi:hypothetical protein